MRNLELAKLSGTVELVITELLSRLYKDGKVFVKDPYWRGLEKELKIPDAGCAEPDPGYTNRRARLYG